MRILNPARRGLTRVRPERVGPLLPTSGRARRANPLSLANAARTRIVAIDGDDGSEIARGTVEEFVQANFDDADLCDALETWALSGMRNELRTGGGATPVTVFRALRSR